MRESYRPLSFYIAAGTHKQGFEGSAGQGNPLNVIRQMPGDPKSPYVVQQYPYVNFMKEGIFYNMNGNSLKSGYLPVGHIPLNQFDISKMPKF